MSLLDDELSSPIGRLKYCDAVLARYKVMKDAQKVEQLKDTVAGLLRQAPAQEVLLEPDIVCMIRELWGEPGVGRIRDRAKRTP